MKELNKKSLEFQDSTEEIEVLELSIPRWLFEDLCKIQATRGIPLSPLLIAQFENLVIDNWDFSSDGPQKERWDE